jgi:hypothetical protein
LPFGERLDASVRPLKTTKGVRMNAGKSQRDYAPEVDKCAKVIKAAGAQVD